MADRSIVLRLKADVTDLQRKLGQAKTATVDASKAFEGYVEKNKASINSLSNTAGVLGGILVAGAALAVKKFADFDQAISGVEASGDDAKRSIDALRQAAIDAGAKTVYSATESANAIENMAKAGVKAADILGGGLTGALNLAAAGSLDVADAAEIAATTMNQFGLHGKDVTHIADVLAASAGKANGEVSDFGLAMKYVGPVASQLGVSLDETAGTLALLAKNGILADSAGTGLRGVMMALTAPSKLAQKALDEYNITAFDAQGKFIGLAGVAGQLHTRLGGLDEATRSAALGQIFGNEQITTARILYANGAAAVKDWTNQVNDQGYAAETAATKLDNLKGDIEQLGGAFDTALIGAGSGANGPLRAIVQQVTEVVNAFTALPDAAQSAALAVVGGGGLIALGAAGIGKLVIGINEAKLALVAMGVTAKTAGIAVAGVGGALAVATLAIGAWTTKIAEANARADEYAGTLDDLGKRTDGTIKKINAALSAQHGAPIFERIFGADASSLIDDAEKFGLAVEDLQGYILGNEDSIQKVAAATKKWQDENLNLFTGTQVLEKTQDFTTALDEQANALTAAEKQTAQKALADEKAGVAQDDLGTSLDATTDAVQDQTEALSDLVKGQAAIAGTALSLLDAQSGLEAAYDDATAAIDKNGATLDLTTEAGRANATALRDIASSGWDLVKSMEANGSTQDELQASLAGTRERFIEVATQMLGSADAAVALADQLNLIPSTINTAVTVDVGNAQAAINSFIISNTGRRIQVGVDAVGGATYSVAGSGVRFNAAGGYQAGPGTSTSDSIPSWLSNGEYVIKASAVQQYGKGFFDTLNAQRFATGGSVGYMPARTSGTSAAQDVVNNYWTLNEVTDPTGTAMAVQRRQNMLMP